MTRPRPSGLRNRTGSFGVQAAMSERIMPTVLVATLVLVGASCGDDPDPSVGDPVTAPTVAPTASDAPGSTPPPSSAPGRPDLPERYVEIDDGTFDSLAEMAAASDVVVVATVTDHEPITSDRDDLNPPVEALLGLRLQVDEVLEGSTDDEIRLVWWAFDVDETGTPIAMNALNGIPVPRPGDQLVLFLTAQTAEDNALLDDPTHAPVKLDGVGFVENGAVTITDDVVPDIAVLHGLTLDEIRAAI